MIVRVIIYSGKNEKSVLVKMQKNLHKYIYLLSRFVEEQTFLSSLYSGVVWPILHSSANQQLL